jgi:ABC-type branched-subunit amino acid transport system ATPase component
MSIGFAIEAQNLKKSFDELQAVKGVNFRAEKGEILSLLGPNGAGKSTTMTSNPIHRTTVLYQSLYQFN